MYEHENLGLLEYKEMIVVFDATLNFVFPVSISTFEKYDPTYKYEPKPEELERLRALYRKSEK